MGRDTKIEWVDHSWNPWWGCVKVSEGCKNCYAEARQYGGDWWGKDKPRRFFGEKHWKQPIKWNEKAGKLGIRYKVFCGSYCDVFEERKELKSERIRLMNLIDQTPNLDWLLLTKRPENLPSNPIRMFGWHHYPDNVWLGVSVENQKQADIRIPELLKIPAKVRFLSCEPLLEEIDLLNINGALTSWSVKYNRENVWEGYINWVICGGESGPNARPTLPDWARSIRDQCLEAGVSYFLKQMGTYWAKDTAVPYGIGAEYLYTSLYAQGDKKGSSPINFPQDLNIRQFPEVA